MKVKPRKAKVSGLPTPRFLRSTAAWRPNSISAGLVRMERQRERLEPLTHRIEEATGVVLVLEAGHQIVGVAHDDHVASGLSPSPALGPEIEHVVQVDVGREAVRSPTLARSPCQLTVTTPSSRMPALSHFRIRRMMRRSPIAVFHEADQPVLAHPVEGSGHRLPIAVIFRIR